VIGGWGDGERKRGGEQDTEIGEREIRN